MALGAPEHTPATVVIEVGTCAMPWYSSLEFKSAILVFNMNSVQSHPDAGFRNAIARTRKANENSTAVFILQEKILSLLKISNMKENNDLNNNQKKYQLIIFTLGL